MDFSEILQTINAYIPTDIAGIDPLYVASALVGLILFVWVLLKLMKKKPQKELVDPVAQESQEENPEEDTESVDVAETEEEGFMPTVTQEEETMIEEASSAEETVVTEEESSVQDVAEAKPEVRKSDVKRKKRDSTRGNRKISKADFSDFSGQRILIAEDNLINQKVINGVLNESGIEVVMADDGQFVMEILEKDSDFEIILMDAHMPRMDGFEATRAIRENPAYDHIVVVALSGDTAVDDIRHMNEAGMEEHLEKPLKMDALYDVMSMYYSMDDEAPVQETDKAVASLEIEPEMKEEQILDYDMGLDICGNDEVMYKELLKEFFVGYKDSSKRLHAALVDKDVKEAQNILIDVKGTASNLGSKAFLQVVDAFLHALNSNDASSFPKLFKEYQASLLALLQSIQAAFKA